MFCVFNFNSKYYFVPSPETAPSPEESKRLAAKSEPGRLPSDAVVPKQTEGAAVSEGILLQAANERVQAHTDGMRELETSTRGLQETQIGRKEAIGLLLLGGIKFLASMGTGEIFRRLGGSVAYAQESVLPTPNTDPTPQSGNPGQEIPSPEPSPQIPPTPNTDPTPQSGNPGQRTPEPTPTNTPTNTPEPTSTRTPEPTPTNTPTNTPEPTSTRTPEPTSTRTPEPTPTNTPTATPRQETPTPTNTPTATRTPEPTQEPTQEPTATPQVLPTPVAIRAAKTSGALIGSGRQTQGGQLLGLGLGSVLLATGVAGLGAIIRRRTMLAKGRLEKNKIEGGQKPNSSSGNGGNNSGGGEETIQQRSDFTGDDKNNAIF